jgi:Protein of unknown function (DUF2510)
VANDAGVRPGWYADPLRRFELRWYNGTAWTADVSRGGERFVDPLGVTVPPEAPTVAASGGGAATASMVLGIVAIALAWVPFVVVLGILAAVLALVFGWVGFRRAGSGGSGRSRAVVGLVTGASALLVSVIGVVLSLIVLDVYRDYVDPPPHRVEVTSCELAGSRATAAGTLENLGDDASDFTVHIAFVRPGTDNPVRTARATLEDVAPGSVAEFEVERQIDLTEVDCIVIAVDGPLPFGLSLD